MDVQGEQLRSQIRVYPLLTEVNKPNLEGIFQVVKVVLTKIIMAIKLGEQHYTTFSDLTFSGCGEERACFTS